jgi:hypothetical protein
MKLTRKERHSIYKEAKKLQKEENSQFMCDNLRDAAINIGFYSDVFEQLKEFFTKKPKKIYTISDYSNTEIWFPEEDQASRIAILNKCLKETR